MNLFSMIPDDFFKILTSKHKVLYLEVLFMLDDLMRGLIFVSREQVVETLQNYFLETGILPMNIEEEESVEVKTHRALAQSVLRELERKGWIRIIYENPNDEQISFPRYANRMVAVLKELEKSDHNAYARYVFTTYSSLKIGIEGGGNEWMALDSAWKATQDLQRVLQNTYFELNEIYNEILNDLSTNDILSRHFDVYQNKIIDQVLYPLKTNDSIPRFKQSILSLLDMYGEEALMERMINQQRKKDNGKEHDEGEVAARKIQDHLNELTDFYSDISGMLNLIDHKTQEYTTKSIGKIQYRLRSDFQLKGTIDTLIKYTKSADADSFAFLEWHDFGLVSQESLYTPRTVKPDIREKERLTVNRREMIAVSDEAVVEKLRKMIHQKFSGQNVDKFVLEQLGGKDQISSKEILLQDYDSFILTIMGAIRGYGHHPQCYHVVFGKEQVRNGRFELPLFYFIGGQKDV